MEPNCIKWPKDCRENARKNGEALVAFGFDQSTLPGCTAALRVVTACDARTAQIITTFASNMVHAGLSMEDAYARMVEAVKNYDERQAAKESAR